MKKTPSPQSVERVKRYLDRLAKSRQHDQESIHAFDLGEPSEAELLVSDLRALVDAAAPAPSSLAGGEVHEAVALEVRMAMQDEMMASDANGGRVSQRIARANRAADTILAALSPEAPAREGATHPDAQPFERFPELALHIERMAMTGLVGSGISWDAFLRELNAALTPRHEAPPEGAGELDDWKTCPVCFDAFKDEPQETQADAATWVKKFKGSKHGGAWIYTHPNVDRAIVHNHNGVNYDGRSYASVGEAKEAALRARSSAPEAREGEPVGVVYSLKADLNTAELPDGTLLYTHPAPLSADHAELTRLAEAAGEEALGNLLAVIHGDGGHRALEVGTKQAALEAEKIVAGLFAAPSADKLRIAVEALEPFRKVHDVVRSKPGAYILTGAAGITVSDVRRADQALAALKAECA